MTDRRPPDAAACADRDLRIINRARLRRILQAALIHDLKAPLNTATLVLDLLGRSLATDDPGDPAVRARLLESLDVIRREVRRIAEALPELLSPGDPEEEPIRPFDLTASLESGLDLLRQQVLLRGARVQRRLLSEPLVVAGRPAELQHAILNVVLNALEATPRGGEIRVQAERRGAAVVLLVEDSGPGIPADLGARVFEPRVTSREGREGLGLPVARSILEEHGGRIGLHPREGGGTVAVIELPLAAEVASAAPAPSALHAAPGPPEVDP